jgi:hypothetical protein
MKTKQASLLNLLVESKSINDSKRSSRKKRQLAFGGGFGLGFGAYDYNDYYGDYVSDYAYDYYDWVCSEQICQLCDILTSECCDPDRDVNCFLPDSCLNNPCLSGGTCITSRTIDNRPDFICVCLPGLTGKYCQMVNDYFVGAEFLLPPVLPIPPGPLAANPIAPGPIASNSIAPGPIASNSIAPGPIASNSIAPGPIASNSIAPGPIASNSIAPGSIEANPIASGSMGASPISLGQVQAIQNYESYKSPQPSPAYYQPQTSQQYNQAKSVQQVNQIQQPYYQFQPQNQNYVQSKAQQYVQYASQGSQQPAQQSYFQNVYPQSNGFSQTFNQE